MIKRLSPCPIIEALIQINCTFLSDPDIVVGQVLNLLTADNLHTATVEKLPLLELPEAIRLNDPNLRDKPWYKLTVGDYYVLIGLFGIAFGIIPPYKNWVDFKDFALNVFDRLKGKLITSIESVSLKYLDFFADINILEKANCEICMNGQKITEIPTIFRTEIRENEFVKAVQITNGAHLTNQALSIDNDGSLIEINLFTRNVVESEFARIIEKAHSIQKNSFFELLKKEYIETFEIEYE